MPESPRKSYGTEIGIAIAVVLPLLYLASFGIAVRHFESARAPSPTMEKFLELYFSPIIWLHNHTPLEGPLERFAELWMK